MKESLVFFGGTSLGFLTTIFFNPDAITAAGTIVLAFIGWRALDQVQIMKEEAKRQDAKDQNLSVASQVHFFRTDILTLNSEVEKLVRNLESRSGIKLPLIEIIEEFSLEWLFNNRTRDVLIQQLFLQAINRLEDDKVHSFTILLNALEEFSINVLASNTASHPRLISVKKTFVLIIEANIWPIVITAPYSDQMYPAVKELYKVWKNEIDRTRVEVIQKRIDEDIERATEKIKSVMSREEYRRLREIESSIKTLPKG